jgi:hypothetical protein
MRIHWNAPPCSPSSASCDGQVRNQGRYRSPFLFDLTPELQWLSMISNYDADCDLDSDPEDSRHSHPQCSGAAQPSRVALPEAVVLV